MILPSGDALQAYGFFVPALPVKGLTFPLVDQLSNFVPFGFV